MSMQFQWIVTTGKLKWRQRDGTELALADMDCGHLRNVAAMLLRNRQAALAEAEACAGYSGGDMAEMYAGHAMDEAFDKAEKYRSMASIVRRYAALREEYNMLLEGPK